MKVKSPSPGIRSVSVLRPPRSDFDPAEPKLLSWFFVASPRSVPFWPSNTSVIFSISRLFACSDIEVQTSRDINSECVSHPLIFRPPKFEAP